MEFVSLPKKSPERKAITTKLRNRGNLKHNVKTFQSGTGLLIAAKGTKKKGAVNNKKKTTQIEKKYIFSLRGMRRNICTRLLL